MRVWVEYAVWWLLLTVGYLGLITSPSGWEIPVGVAIGAAVAGVAVLARRAFAPALRPPSFVRGAVLLPLDVASDAIGLLRLLLTGRALRDDCGELDGFDLPGDTQATRAWAVLLTSAAPGSLTVDVEERGARLVLLRHRLTGSSRATARLERR